jgi:Tol biopolymer transport system component
MRNTLLIGTFVTALLLVSCSSASDDTGPTPAGTVAPTPTSEEITLPLKPDQPILYSIRPDGTGVRAIYHGRTFLGYALSPDGQTIAVDDFRPDVEVLSLMDTNTGELEEIVRADWLNLFSWSPDGNWLIFDMILEQNGDRARYLYSAEDAMFAPVDDVSDSFSGVRAWAPDSSAVYVANGYAPNTLSRIDIPSLEAVSLGVQFDKIALSPDGEWFAVGLLDREEGGSSSMLSLTIDVMRVDGSEQRELAQFDDVFVLGGLSWSPDGARIAFAPVIGGGENGVDSGVFVTDVETAETIRISDAPEGVDVSARWSADGDKLLIRRHICTQCDGIGSKFLIAAADGSGEVHLGTSDRFVPSAAAWSPDGSQYVYGANALFVGEAAGGSERILDESDPSFYGGFTWSPDASEIFYVRNTGSGSAVYAAQPDGSSLTVLGGGDVVPSPDGRFTVSFEPDTGEPEISAAQGRGGDLRHEALIGVRLQSSDFDWSPDSRWLAVMAGGKGGGPILLWDARDSGDMHLVETPGRVGAIRWSPRGDRFAYSDQSDLWAVDASSGERELLVSGNFAAFDWSPGAGEMAVLDQQSLSVVPLDGVEDRRVVMEAPSPQWSPTLRWSPDGERIAIDDIGIQVISAATGQTELNVQGGGMAWSRDGRLAFGAPGSEHGELPGGIHIYEPATDELTQLTESGPHGHLVRGWLDNGRVIFASFFVL